MSAIDIGLYCLYVFVLVAILSAIVLPFIHLVKNPSGLIRGAVAILIILAVFFIGYAFSSSEVTAKHISLGVDGQGIKFIGGGLTLLYVFVLASLGAIILSELGKMFK